VAKGRKKKRQSEAKMTHLRNLAGWRWRSGDDSGVMTGCGEVTVVHGSDNRDSCGDDCGVSGCNGSGGGDDCVVVTW
jgi:hypothetical protein